MQTIHGKNLFIDHIVIGILGAGNSTVYSISKVIVKLFPIILE